MELWLLDFEERDKFTLQRVEGKGNSKIGGGFPSPPPPPIPPPKKCDLFGECNSVRIVQITDPKRGIVGKIYIC